MEARPDLVVFVGALQARLTGSLALFCGDRLVADDLAQETLARVVERWDVVRAMDAPEAWTYRVAFNLARSWGRRRAAERRAHARLRQGRHEESTQSDTDTALVVRAALAKLPSRQRAALVARFYADLSVDQAAAALGCAPGTVKALTHQAIAALRTAGLAIADEEEDLDAAPT